MFKTNFPEHYKIWKVQKDLGVFVPELPPLSVGLGRTDARKSSIWGLLVCAGG